MLARIEINLLPAEYRVRARQIKVRREIIYPVLGFIILGVFMILWFLKITNDIRIVQVSISTINSEMQQNQHVKEEITRLENEKRTIQEKIGALEMIDVSRAKWVRIQEIVCQYLPEQTWLKVITENDTKLQLQGATYSFPEVASYMSGLAQSDYISAVDLINIEQAGGDSRSKIFNFTIMCTPNFSVTPEETGGY